MKQKKNDILSILQKFDLMNLVIHEGSEAYNIVVEEIATALQDSSEENEFFPRIEAIFKRYFGNYEYENLDQNKFIAMSKEIYSKNKDLKRNPGES